MAYLFDLLYAVLLLAAGFGIFRLLDADLGATVNHFVSRLHLDPENRLIHSVIEWLGGIDRAHLTVIGAGTFFYAGLHMVEGTGLLLRRHWGSYLTIVATGSLLPLEVYELQRKLTAVRLGVLVVNLIVLGYLVFKLRQEHRERVG